MTEQEAWVRFATAHLGRHGHSPSAVKDADCLLAHMRARFFAPVEREADTDTLNDKIDGLECDLDSALEKLAAVCNGNPLDSAARWLRLNYPGHRATLSLTTPPDTGDHQYTGQCVGGPWDGQRHSHYWHSEQLLLPSASKALKPLGTYTYDPIKALWNWSPA